MMLVSHILKNDTQLAAIKHFKRRQRENKASQQDL